MALPKARGETLGLNDQVNLTVQFKDQFGAPINTDLVPKISIVQPSGTILLAPTSSGVVQVSTGKYSYTFTVPYGGPLGVFQDVWSGTIGGFSIENVFSFVVSNGNIPSVAADGYAHLGDDPGYNYSQVAIKNINKMIKMLKGRLNSTGVVKGKDASGNITYQNCDIFSIDTLTAFLAMALSYFNSVPYSTFFTFDDSEFVSIYGEILVEAATMWALASQALISRGSEFQVTDSGISYSPPTVSELLQTQYSGALSLVWDQIKYIKNSMRPSPLGMGTWGSTNGSNVAFRRLRHLRARRYY